MWCDKVSLITCGGVEESLVRVGDVLQMCWVRVSPCVGEGCHMGVTDPICHLAGVISAVRMPCEGIYELLSCLVKACV